MIVYLLLGLFEATSGEILIDGINIKEINKRYLREKISAIMQESELFKYVNFRKMLRLQMIKLMTNQFLMQLRFIYS